MQLAPPTRVQARVKQPDGTYARGYVNAMRPHWLGNPYPISEYSLEESLEKYEIHLREKINSDTEFRKRFYLLHNRTVGCTCPLNQECHVNVIIKVWKEIFRFQEE